MLILRPPPLLPYPAAPPAPFQPSSSIHPPPPPSVALAPWLSCRITLELRDRQAKVDVLAAKFETLAARNRETDAEGGEPKSQAYYIVKVGGSNGWSRRGEHK